MIFRNLVFAALIVGIISGISLGLIQQFAVTPIILAAEQYEVDDQPSEATAHSHAMQDTAHQHKTDASLTAEIKVETAIPHDHSSHDHSAITQTIPEPIAEPVSASPTAINEAPLAHHHTAVTSNNSHADDGHTGHSHDPDAWAPEDGVERTAYTFGANILSSMGFALLMLGGMTLAGKATPTTGILWGLAGYATFFIAPSLGQLPEIPGMEAAALEGRQTWWLLTTLLTATGLGLIAFGHVSLKVIGLVLLAIPHLLGAPQPELHGFAHPDTAAITALESLAADFLWATAVANGIFWLIVGVTSGYFINKFKILEE